MSPRIAVPRADERCCSPNRAGSAPAWRWRSRPWRGWSGSSSRPCTATTRSSTTGSSSTGSASSGVIFVDDIDDVPAGAPLMLSAHGSAPEVVGRGAGPGPVRGERGVPARHQGPPRGQGAGREGLHGPLRRPRRPRRGRRHARGRARRDPAGRARGRPRRGAARASTTRRKVALLAQTTLSLHDWEGDHGRAPASGSPSCGPRPATTCASPPPTARRALHGDRGAGRRRRGDRERQLVEHDRARQGGDRGRVPVVLRVDGPDELDPDALGDAARRRRHRRRERARGPRAGGDRRGSPRPTASSSCTSPTRTSTSRRRGSCAS